MPPSIKLKCEACGGDALVQLRQNVIDVLARKIQAEDPCPTCGGGLSCPGGYYRKDAHNMLIRVGDFSPPTATLN